MTVGARGQDSLLDRLDFNDYAVGVTTAVAQQPYRGVGHTQTLFPFLTSLEDSTMTDAAFVARNGAYGLRRVFSSGFEMGVHTRIETLGFGADPDPPLDRLDPPQWTLELGPSIGLRRGLLQPDLALRKGIWGGHDDWVGEFSLSLPMESPRGYLVPFAMASYLGEDYLDHYFGVRPRAGAGPFPTDYAPPDRAITYRLGLRFGYRISDLWLLTGSGRIDWLDGDVEESPLVDRGTLAGFSLGLAYNRSIFVEQNPDWRGELRQRRLSVSVYSVAGTASTDLEARPRDDLLTGFLPLDRHPDFTRADVILRIRDNHRLELSYANVDRSRSSQASAVAAGVSRLEQGSRFVRTAYGYSLRNTAQQELGILLGVHWPRLTATLNRPDSPDLEVDAQSPLFAVGAFGRLAMRRGFSAEARLELGGLDIDQYDGAVLDGRASLVWRPRDSFALVLGYSWQFSRLEGNTDEFKGRFAQRTHGPHIGLRVLM